MFSCFLWWRPTATIKSHLTPLCCCRLLAVLLTHPHLSQYSLESSCHFLNCYAATPTPLTSSPHSTPIAPIGMTLNSLSSHQGPTLPTSTPLNISPSVRSAVYAPPITYMDVNLQVSVSLLFYLGLFLLLYWSRIYMTHSSTSLSFILIPTYTGTQIAISIRLTFAFHLRLPYRYRFYLNLTILILLL